MLPRAQMGSARAGIGPGSATHQVKGHVSGSLRPYAERVHVGRPARRGRCGARLVINPTCKYGNRPGPPHSLATGCKHGTGVWRSGLLSLGAANTVCFCSQRRAWMLEKLLAGCALVTTYMGVHCRRREQQPPRAASGGGSINVGSGGLGGGGGGGDDGSAPALWCPDTHVLHNSC